MTPTQRTLAALRADGWCAEVVERWNPHARVRQDLFGGIDILALRGAETLGVQCTTTGVAERVRKLRALDTLATMLAAGWRVEVWGWRKACAAGKRRGRKTWQPRVVVLSDGNP